VKAFSQTKNLRGRTVHDSGFLTAGNEQNELTDRTCIMATVQHWCHINKNKGDSNC